MGTETTDVVGMKRWLAFLEGGLLPLISLTSLHFFVTYEKEDEAKEEVKKKSSLEQDVVKIIEANENPPEPNEKLKEAKKSFDEEIKQVEDDTDEVSEVVEELVDEKIEEEMKEGPVEIQKDEEFDEAHALDMVLNDMVDDLMEDEGVETVEELIEVLEDETIVEEIAKEEEKKDEQKLKGRSDVTINNKLTKRKMGIDRIK